MKSKWFSFKGTIKDVNVIRKFPKAMGLTRTRPHSFSIQIARKHVKTKFTLAETLIHELAHLWVEMMVALDIITPTKAEKHEIIYSLEHYATHILKRRYNWK